MASLTEIRAQHPEYHDLSDQQLADGIYKKFYADMPREQFDAKIGLKQPDQGALAASTRSMGNTLSFGLMEDAVARASAGVIDPIKSWITGEDSGETYAQRLDRHLASQHAQDRAAQEQHPIASAVGTGGAIAAVAPRAAVGLVAPVMRAATGGERLINAGIGAAKGAAGGAGYGFASGFGAGEGGVDNRVQSGLEQAPAGALVGGVGGAALGGFAKMPVTAPSEVAAAADRSGVYVPQALASDNPAVQQAGGAAKSIPVFGTRITNAGKRTAEEFTAEKARIAEGYGGGAAADAHSAGQEATDALKNWAGPLTQGVLKNEYDAVDRLITSSVKTPLNHTLFDSKAIEAKNLRSGLPPGGAVKFVQEALAKPGGMEYWDIKHLRSKMREMLDNPSVIPPEIDQQEFERLYKSLTRDLRASVANSGGAAATAQFEKANTLAAKVARRREEIAQVLGVNKEAPPEAVFATIQRKAGSRSSADIEAVNKLRKSMPPDVWDQVASGVVGELGRSDALGGVSLDRFFTGYNQLSDAGKAALFGNKPDLHAALDDLAIIARRGKEVAKWANPSGTAQHGAYIAAGAALGHPTLWPKIALSAIGAHFMTKALTRAATVRAMTAWARVMSARQINRLGGGGPAQKNIDSLQFVSRRFAVEIGHQFGLAAGQVDQMAKALATPPNPDGNANDGQ